MFIMTEVLHAYYVLCVIVISGSRRSEVGGKRVPWRKNEAEVNDDWASPCRGPLMRLRLTSLFPIGSRQDSFGTEDQISHGSSGTRHVVDDSL